MPRGNKFRCGCRGFGGLMGSGIATALILSNYPVILKEVNEKFLDAGINRIKGENRFL